MARFFFFFPIKKERGGEIFFFFWVSLLVSISGLSHPPFFCTKTYACERPWHLSWVDIYLPLHVSKWADVRDEWSLVLCDQDEGHILIVACLWFPLCQPLLLLFGFSSRFSFFFCYLLFVLTTNKIEKQRLYALLFFFSKIGGPYSFFFFFFLVCFLWLF